MLAFFIHRTKKIEVENRKKKLIKRITSNIIRFVVDFMVPEGWLHALAFPCFITKSTKSHSTTMRMVASKQARMDGRIIQQQQHKITERQNRDTEKDILLLLPGEYHHYTLRMRMLTCLLADDVL